MNDDPLLETAWLLSTWGLPYFAPGLAGASVMVVLGSRCRAAGVRLAILVLATVVLWAALFVGVDCGYRAWQSSPDPPQEAFSDTGGPFAALFLGWLPSGLWLAALHGLLRNYWRAPAVQPPPLPDSRGGSD